MSLPVLSSHEALSKNSSGFGTSRPRRISPAGVFLGLIRSEFHAGSCQVLLKIHEGKKQSLKTPEDLCKKPNPYVL